MTRTMTSNALGSGTSISSIWNASTGSPWRSSRMTHAAIVGGSSPGSVSTRETCDRSTAMARKIIRPSAARRSGLEEAGAVEPPPQQAGRQRHAPQPVAHEGLPGADVVHQPPEVLAEEPGHERQRQEDRRHQGELLRDLAEAVLDRGEVDVQRAGQEIAVGVDLLGDPQQVVVDVPEPVACLVGLEARQPLDQLAAAGHDVALGTDDAP